MKQLAPREYWPLAYGAKQLGATVNDMIHAAGQRQIQLCINLFQLVEEEHRHRIPMPDEELTNSELSTGLEDAPLSTDELLAHQEFWARTTTGMPDGLYELYFDDARRLELSATDTICIKEAVRFDGKEWWIAEFKSAADVDLEKLVIRSEELHKFQIDHATAGADKLDKRERSSFLNLIGLMVQALRAKPGGQHSESAVIQRLLDMEMRLRASPEKKLYGLSQRNLEKQFQSARESLEMAGILVTGTSTEKTSLKF